MKIATILIGKNSLSEIFIKKKKEFCERKGIDFQSYSFPVSISFNDLKKEIQKINKNSKIKGIIIQLPLPKKFKKKEQEILDLISPEKDIDFLTTANFGKYYLSPIVRAVAELLKKEKIKGKYVVLVGAGKLVGLPLSIWFLKQGAYVSVLNELTPDISAFCKKADILISGVGKPGLIRKQMIKKRAIVIDIGNCLVKKKIKGDIEFSNKAKLFIPAVGGIGPLTIKYLLKNFNES